MPVVDDKVGVNMLRCNLVDTAAANHQEQGARVSPSRGGGTGTGVHKGDAPAVGRVRQHVELLLPRQTIPQGPVDRHGVVQLLISELECNLFARNDRQLGCARLA